MSAEEQVQAELDQIPSGPVPSSSIAFTPEHTAQRIARLDATVNALRDALLALARQVDDLRTQTDR